MASFLDYKQGDNNKGYNYDCGLASCENVLIETGVFAERSSANIVKGIDQEESTVVDYAAAHGLCSTNSSAYYNGLTNGTDLVQVLNHFGVSATNEYTTITGIANAIQDNECVITAVDASKLWGLGNDQGIDHFITITGVDYSATNSSQIDGFYICDSGRGLASDADRFISTSLMASVFDYASYDGIAYGNAVITNESNSQSVSGSAGSTNGAVSVNSIIQQMTGFTTGTEGQIASTINNNQQNPIALIAGHSA